MNSGAAFGIKQFRAEGCLSYFVWDPHSRRTALIDPHLDLMDDYREFLAGHRLALGVLLETHTHADHYSCSHLLARELGLPIGMSAGTRSARATLRLADGERISLGSLSIEAMDMPGHTPDSLVYRLGNCIFTGDTLLLGSTGRTDFPGADPEMLWKGLERLRLLPPETLVFPGHDYSELLFGTVGSELERNEDLAEKDRARFLARKREECLAQLSGEVRERIAYNLEASPEREPATFQRGAAQCGRAISGDSDRSASISVDKYVQKLEQRDPGTLFVDVREPEEFSEGHIPGTRNIPLSQLGFHLEELKGARRVYFSCLSGRRSAMAARTLSHVGHPDVVNVTGGYKAWTQGGHPVE